MSQEEKIFRRMDGIAILEQAIGISRAYMEDAGETFEEMQETAITRNLMKVGKYIAENRETVPSEISFELDPCSDIVTIKTKVIVISQERLDMLLKAERKLLSQSIQYVGTMEDTECKK